MRDYQRINFTNPYRFKDEILDQLSQDNRFGKHQYAAWDFAFQGDYANALKQWDLGKPSSINEFSTKHVDSLTHNYQLINAKKYLTGIVGNYRIVIINEAHQNSFHRHFTASLLQIFYNNGFKYLGLEDLRNGREKDSLLNTRKYPIQSSGFYIKDPQYGSMVRKALKIGFEVFPYEETVGVNNEKREIEQAKNIKNFIDDHPDEKVLIYCGFGHVMEGEFPSGEKVVAERLKKLTGIDPLTIDQVRYSEKSKLDFDVPLIKALKFSNPSILLDQNGKAVQNRADKMWTDIAILQPATEFINNRPSWIFDKERKKVKLELSDIDIQFPIMVLAFKKDEDYSKAIPVDIIEIKKPNKAVYLSLNPGAYTIIATNKKQESRKFKIQVK